MEAVVTISAATRVACVIGDPVEHSRSPRMHNAAPRRSGSTASTSRCASRRPTWRGGPRLAALGVDGANVTLPHKAAAAALCDELGAEARDAGAVNTLSFRPTGECAAISPTARPGRGARARCPSGPSCSAPAAARAPPPRRCCAPGRAGSRRRPAPRGRGRAGRRARRLVPGAQVDAAAAVPASAAACSSTARRSAASPTSRRFRCLPM